ncbi:MAG: hypothetical protein WHV44_00980 [Anaerolineales bacterium]
MNIFTVFAAAFVVVSVALVLFSYAPADKPYWVWRSFALGFAAWATAEIVWSFYNLGNTEVPVPSIADGLWYLGYLFFTMGFIRQYRIAYQTKAWFEWGSAALVWAVVLGLTMGATFFINDGQLSLPALVDISYPFADLALIVFALGLVWAFRGGAFARPWLSMVVFALSDGLYAWLVQTGTYAWSVDAGNPLSLATDMLYLVAYFVIGLGFFSQYHLLHNFPKIKISTDISQ